MFRYHFSLIALLSCLWSYSAVAEIKAVASFSILADMVQQVAGEDAQVSSIVGPDADAHLYSPNAADAIAVTKADIIFVNGLGFETWSSDLIANSGTTAPVVTVTEKVIPLLVEGSVDPHAWNNIGNGILYVEAIAKGLSQVDPANASAYKVRAEAYIKKLTALDAEAKDLLAPIAPEKRIVVTAHDAFGYLANAYDMTFLAPVGINDDCGSHPILERWLFSGCIIPLSAPQGQNLHHGELHCPFRLNRKCELSYLPFWSLQDTVQWPLRICLGYVQGLALIQV